MIKLDYSKIDDVEVDGFQGGGPSDFCDAYITSASYGDREMTADELTVLNEDSDYVYACVIKRLY